MGVLVYNGLRSTDYQVVVEHPPVFTMPERDYEKVHVPGRNGDVIVDNGSYQNSKAKYDICFGSYTKKFPEMVYQVSRWLHSAQGQYARLEDSYDPDHFRMAAYLEENEFENIMFHAGRATVEFDCKPQRFLKSGEQALKYLADKNEIKKEFSVHNPTAYDSLPAIQIDIRNANPMQQVTKIYVVKIDCGSQSVTIYIPKEAWQAYYQTLRITIDSDLQEVTGNIFLANSKPPIGEITYDDPINLNPNSYFKNNEFLVIKPGANDFVITLYCQDQSSPAGLFAITDCAIIPKWWTL